MNIGEILRNLRTLNNLTQKDIANILGITRSTYKDYELNISIIPIKHLVKISEYYNVSIDYILNLNNKNKYPNSLEISYIKAGQRLKEFRQENKITQKDLARTFNIAFSAIGHYEKGRNLIATSFLYTICKKYNISADYLLGKTDEPKYLK